MTPRQQRMLDAIRECLLRPAATDRLQGDLAFTHALPSHDARETARNAALSTYAEEASRNLVGVIEEVLREEAEERVPAPDPIPQAGCTCLACEQLRDYQRRGIANAWRRRDAADAAVRALLDLLADAKRLFGVPAYVTTAANEVRRFYPEAK